MEDSKNFVETVNQLLINNPNTEIVFIADTVNDVRVCRMSVQTRVRDEVYGGSGYLTQTEIETSPDSDALFCKSLQTLVRRINVAARRNL